jgi:general stress protein YciG
MSAANARARDQEHAAMATNTGKKKMTKAEAGQGGGIMTYTLKGRKYMRKIGRRGGRKTHKLYDMQPIGQRNFAYVHRETGEIKALQYGNKQFQEQRRLKNDTGRS